MGVADEAAGWLYGKVKERTMRNNTLEDASNTVMDDTGLKIQLIEQQASRAKFDKWIKRGAALAIGAGVAYWYMKLRKEK